jgi:membrane fusion protein (multidrug efflux system)
MRARSRPSDPTPARRGACPRVRALVLLLAAVLFSACGSSDTPPPPPLEISVVDVLVRDQPIEMEMVGETLGSSDIPVRARVEGVLTGMNFVEGRLVEKGQLLYTIDPEPFEAEVVEAEGTLAEAKTHLAKAKADLDRIRPLAEMDAVSQSDLDGAVAQYEAARGSLQSAEARVDQAQIRLGYTRIHSPIDGRIGISQARVGEFVGRVPNPVVLNFVSDIDPIRVRFSIDERTYLVLARRLRELHGEPGEPSKMGRGLRLTLADGSQHPYSGRVVAMDAAVDPKTGTFKFEADFANPETLVVAGQFARVRATAETRKDAILVPSRAVAELQGNFRVFVVADDGTVELRPVTLGPKIDNLQIIESGLAPGERVAVEIIKLQPGMKVKPRRVEITADGRIEDAEQDAAGPGADASASGEVGSET